MFSLSKEWDRLISFLTPVYMDLPRGEHFKAYINPCLNAANLSNLGFNIGPVCISAICIADDTYVISGNPRDLQGLINIIGHYGKRYRLVFGSDKTKITITGSKHDMEYYKKVSYW